MTFFNELFITPSVTQSIVLLTLVVFLGLWAGERLKIRNFTFGVTWILFVGIALSAFGLTFCQELRPYSFCLFYWSSGGPFFLAF